MLERILLAEDFIDYQEAYMDSLIKERFQVTLAKDGWELYTTLKRDKFDAIVSDSDLPMLNGYESCKRAIKNGILDDKNTLIIGMSWDPENQEYWRGLANIGCFYNKNRFKKEELGRIVKQCLTNYKSGGLWHEKMPKIET